MIDIRDHWPAEKPAVPLDDHGWMLPQNAKLLAEHLGPETCVVAELGSWLGQSTRHILDCATNAVVFAIDHWKGGPDHQGPNGNCNEKLATLYETFLVNCWDYKDRLVPLKMDTHDGMFWMDEHGIVPDLVYVDADHSYEAVKSDIEMALKLFPKAKILGDDWGWGVEHGFPIKRAVVEVARANGMEYEVRQNWAWRLIHG